ncbi:hypothetical protein D047_4930A, partial [Vibrio parahaemolyticus VPTS-2010_2]
MAKKTKGAFSAFFIALSH